MFRGLRVSVFSGVETWMRNETLWRRRRLMLSPDFGKHHISEQFVNSMCVPKYSR